MSTSDHVNPTVAVLSQLSQVMVTMQLNMANMQVNQQPFDGVFCLKPFDEGSRILHVQN